jgi:hypothetical protein
MGLRYGRGARSVNAVLGIPLWTDRAGLVNGATPLQRHRPWRAQPDRPALGTAYRHGRRVQHSNTKTEGANDANESTPKHRARARAGPPRPSQLAVQKSSATPVGAPGVGPSISPNYIEDVLGNTEGSPVKGPNGEQRALLHERNCPSHHREQHRDSPLARGPTRPPRNALAIASPRWDDAVCVRMKSGMRKPPRGTTHRALACSLQRCWVRPLTAWPSLREVARRLSSRSVPLVGHCHDRNRSFDLSPCLAALVRT